MIKIKNYMLNTIYIIKKDNYSMIVGIILAAGTSSRFKSDTPKQLYSINNKPIIEYSIDMLIV
jgi:2-C-methyl-D-erythritol 4-phosphate cytidylyltransferase